MTNTTDSAAADLRQRIVAEQVRAHYAQIPAMAFAPSAGGLFSAVVLWGAVPHRWLVIGLVAVWVLSAARLWLRRRYLACAERDRQRRWRIYAVIAALASGCIWGCAAPFLYPLVEPGHRVFLMVLLTLLPIVPVAALASYVPTLFAYYVPCAGPFIVLLWSAGSMPERMAAVLLLLMMGAMLTFASKYSASLADGIALEMKLAAKAQALEEALRQKTSFISGASHDLKQPVHAMGLFIELLRRGDGRFTPRQGLDYLAGSLRSLRDMLSDMLHVSKLDAGQVKPELQHFDCGAMLRRLRDEYAPLAAAQGLSLRCRGADRVVISDPALLERMLRNLLSNALKFTHEGGVALLCRGLGPTVRLQVVDTGIGIHPDDRVRVFDEFTRLDDRDRDESKGLGLGLAIVQRLALLLGHRVSLASRPGHGSAFTIDVGLGDAARVVRAVAPPAPPQPLPAGQWVMIVDDDAAVRSTTAALFEQWGMRAVTAASSVSALAALRGHRAAPALLVVDLHLAAGESGLALIAALRDHHKLPALPSILVTGDATALHAALAQRDGILLLRKPVDPADLERSARAVLVNGAG